MKKLIIVLIILLLLAPTGRKEISLKAEELEALGIAGLMVSLPVVSDGVDPEPEPKPVACACNKTTGKISYDGGTSLTDCPCKNGAAKCGCKYCVSAEIAPEVIPENTVTIDDKIIDLIPRVVLFTDLKTCSPCRGFDKNVVSKLKNAAHKKAGWKVGTTPDCNLQILDINDIETLVEMDRLNLSASLTPTFFRLTSNAVTVHTGSMNYEKFIDWSGAIPKKK